MFNMLTPTVKKSVGYIAAGSSTALVAVTGFAHADPYTMSGASITALTGAMQDATTSSFTVFVSFGTIIAIGIGASFGMKLVHKILRRLGL